MISSFVFQIFLGRVVSYVAPSFQVVRSEDYSALTRDPEQVMPITLNNPLNLTVKFSFNRFRNFEDAMVNLVSRSWKIFEMIIAMFCKWVYIYRLTHSASELSGFTCMSSLTMNEKFQYRTRPPRAVLKNFDLFIIQIEYTASKNRLILSQPKPWCNDSGV